MDTILIWGAGAVGGTIGAFWKRAGVDVLLVDKVRPSASRPAAPKAFRSRAPSTRLRR